MPGTLYAGTSGFAYKEWKPEFYPPDLKAADFLLHYARHFRSVEINNTFYRAPTPKLLTSWLEQTPDDFSFTLKAPQRITHFQRLRDVDENLSYFLETARALGPRLGCILFQCPPTLRADLDLLERFLAALPGDPFRFAMEFRHESWATDAARELLRRCGVAWCTVDTGEASVALIETTPRFVYARLRGLAYTDDELRAWADRVGAALERGADAYVYFKHEDDPSGVRFGLRFRELLEGRA